MHHTQTVLIADQDDDARAHLAGTLRDAGFDVVETAAGDEALEMVRRLPLAAVVLDVALAGLSGYEVCRAIRSDVDPQMPIVFASGCRTESFDRVAGLIVGADDYLVQPVAPDELAARVRALVRRSSERPRETPSSRAAGPRRHLTPREHEILTLVAEGLHQQAIANRLFISSKTVATHIENILRKLDVHSRAQAVALAFRERLIEPDAEPVLGGPPTGGL
jgi:DNA-binding NarL/FixJ family response regulator